MLITTALIAVFASGYAVGERSVLQTPKGSTHNLKVENQKNPTEHTIDFALFWEAWNKLEAAYVDKEKIQPEKLYYGAIKGMVASVGDPYTFFLTPEENKESKQELAGSFFGIGAELGLKNNAIIIVTPIKKSPAERAGVRAGDIITKVNGEPTTNWTLFEAVNKIRGEKGTHVTLTMLREGKDDEITFKITRGEIEVPFVEVTYEGTVAHVQLSRFGDTTDDEWDKLVSDLTRRRTQGTLSGIVLDMRGNPGGLLDSAIHVSSEFVKKGTTIVKQEFADQDPRVYTSNRNGRLIGVPTVILLNKGSASASEIVAGALRANTKAPIIGENSFGKGTVQIAEDLSKGAGIHVTISKWVLPDNTWIHETGIKPDIAIKNDLEDGFTLTRETDKQLDKAIETLIEKKA